MATTRESKKTTTGGRTVKSKRARTTVGSALSHRERHDKKVDEAARIIVKLHREAFKELEKY